MYASWRVILPAATVAILIVRLLKRELPDPRNLWGFGGLPDSRLHPCSRDVAMAVVRSGR